MAEQAARGDDAALAGDDAIQRQFATAGAELGDADRAAEDEGKSEAGLALVEYGGAGGQRQGLQAVADPAQQRDRQLGQDRLQRDQFFFFHAGPTPSVAMTGA